MAGHFKKDWGVPLVLLGLGTPTMIFGIVKALALYTAATTGVLPEIVDAPHHFTRLIPIALHVLAGIVFVLTGPVQFAHRIRIRWPRAHRISGRLYVASGLGVVGAGLWMNQVYPAYGGALKYWGVLGFGLLFLVSIGMALRAIFRRDIQRHRIWMSRAIALGLGPGTQFFLAIALFATIGMTDFGIGVIVVLGFAINLAVAERHIRKHLSLKLLGAPLAHQA